MKSSVNAIIFSKNQQDILVIQRRDVPVWVLPGGMVDQGETPEEAVVREVMEETGCDVTILRKSCVYHPINKLTVTTHVFVCQLKAGSPKIGPETRNIGFFPTHSLPPSFFHIHQDMLKDALENSSQTLCLPLHQVTYFKLFKYFLSHPLRVLRFALSKMGLPINS